MTTTTTATNSPAMTDSTDRIEEQVLLPQSRARVWRALTDPVELGTWFGATLPVGQAIAPGAHVRGQIAIPGYEHIPFDIIIEEMVTERRFSWRWHPHAIERDADYSGEPRTLVTFTLEDAAEGGTRVSVIETGFAALPEARRATAFKGNSGGWRGQLQKRLPGYLASA